LIDPADSLAPGIEKFDVASLNLVHATAVIGALEKDAIRPNSQKFAVRPPVRVV